VGEFVTLKKKGQNLWACCPFHNEKTPSFAVSPNKGFYKCFGCDAAGDAISFIRAIQGISFVEAVKYIAQKYHIPVEESESQVSADEMRLQYEKEKLYILMKFAQNYYTANLWQHPEGKRLGYSYLQERSLHDSLLHTFEIGYSLESWTEFLSHAQQQGFSILVLEQAGLIVQNQEKTYDRFRGRVMFPIHNLAGQTIAFAARMIGRDDSQPKYINSPHTPIYHKGQVVYGLHIAKQSIRQTENCFLVEGYTDVMALHQAGICNTVASGGTALTTTQIESIGRFAKRITVLFDGDAAGTQAALRGIDKILEKGLAVKAILLPAGEDPDSYAKRVGPEGLQDYLQRYEEDFITFKAKLLLQEAGNDLARRAEVIKQILETIVFVPDAIYKSLLLKQSSKILEIEENVLTAEHNKLLQAAQKRQDNALRRNVSKKLQLSVKEGQVIDCNWSSIIQGYEQESMRLLLNYGHTLLEEDQPLHTYLLQELADVTFQHPLYSQMRSIYETRLAQGDAIDSYFFLQHPDEDMKKAAIDLMLSPHAVSEEWAQRYQLISPREEEDLHITIYRNVLRLKLKLIHQLVEDNQQLLKNSPAVEEEGKLLQIHTALKATEIKIGQELGLTFTR
jgi:DNA primase